MPAPSSTAPSTSTPSGTAPSRRAPSRLTLLALPAALALALPAAPAAADEGYPAYVTVPVHLAAAAGPGDTVLISGSTAELGAWDPARAVPLAGGPDDPQEWNGDLHLQPGGQVQYKYLKRTLGGAVTWEDVPDRAVFVSADGTTALNDRWNVGDGNPLITVFNATATTVYGQGLYVTGNLAELGGWDPAKAVPLTTSSWIYPQWTGFASLPPNTAVAYKYLKKNPDGGVIWEDGANRTATTPPTGTFTVNDNWR